MKNSITLFILLMSFCVFSTNASDVARSSDGNKSVTSKRGFIVTHNAFESVSLRLSLGADLKGFVQGKLCDECKAIKVTVTPATKAYAKGVEVPLIEAKSRVGRYATVIYDIETNNASEIRW